MLDPDHETLAEELYQAGTILWVGPAHLAVGASSKAEAALHKAIDRRVVTIVCSEDDRYHTGVPGSRLHLSSGPGAFLEYMERLSLPGITLLDPAVS